MKKIIMIAIGAALLSCDRMAKIGEAEKKRYTIRDSRGYAYRADEYDTLKGGCITFRTGIGTGKGMQKTTVVCGSYTIQEN